MPGVISALVLFVIGMGIFYGWTIIRFLEERKQQEEAYNRWLTTPEGKATIIIWTEEDERRRKHEDEYGYSGSE